MMRDETGRRGDHALQIPGDWDASPSAQQAVLRRVADVVDAL